MNQSSSCGRDEEAFDPEFAREWTSHLAQPLPSDCAEERIDGISPKELDFELTSCIEATLDSESPDRELMIVLSVSMDKLSRLLPHLTGESYTYFARLKNLAHATVGRLRS